MNCSQFEEYASLYIDEMLTEEEMMDFKKHLKTCEECSISLDNLKTIIGTVNEMEEIDLPDNFTLSLRHRLQVEAEKEYKIVNRKSIFNWKIISGVAAGFLIISMSLTALDYFPNREYATMDSAEMKEEYGNRGEQNKELMSVAPQITATGQRSVTTSFTKSKQDVAIVAVDQFDKSEEMTIAEAENTEGAIITVAIATENRKIINTGRLVLETNEFDLLQERVTAIVEANGGYFQNTEAQYRLMNKEKPEDSLKTAYMTIRVPSQSFDKVFRELKEQGMVITENANAQDVTLTYRDVENEVMNMEIQEERLREILKKAEKVEDILRIENELSRVRLQINSMKGTLKNYDQLISLSTIELVVNEVKEEGIKIQSVKVGVWGKAKTDFIKSVNEIIYYGQRTFIKFYGLIPWAILLTVILGPLANFAYKYINKRRNNIEK